MAFPDVPGPWKWALMLGYVIAFFVVIWVVFELVPAIATFIANLG